MHLSQVGLLMVMVAQVVTQNFTTNGESGEPCGDKRCLAAPNPAVCVSDHCVCEAPNSSGLGHLFCVSPNTDICYLHGDPLVRQFNGNKLHHINVLGVNPFAAVNTSVCTASGIPHPSYRCEVQVFVWGQRVLGKGFLKGVEVFFSLDTEEAAYKFYGEVEDGVYTFTRYGSLDDPLEIPGYGQTGVTVDSTNNVLIIGGLCGVEVYFRPVDPANPYLLPSGAAISVKQSCGPDYPNVARELCGGLQNTTADLTKLAELLTIINTFPVDVADAALLVSLFGVNQSRPGSPPAQDSLYNLSSACYNDSYALVYAVPRCSFFLKYPKYNKCLIRENGLDLSSEEADDVSFELFLACVQLFCNKSVTGCVDLQARLVSSSCTGLVPQPENTIIDEDCELIGYLSPDGFRSTSPELPLTQLGSFLEAAKTDIRV